MARYALVIGISEYQSSQMSRLPKAVADAEAVAQVLEQYGNFQVTRLPSRWNAEKNAVEVGTKAVTAEEVGQAFKTLLSEKAEKSEALIYFSGHGFKVVDSLGKARVYLGASNTQIEMNGDRVAEQRYGISLESLNKLIEESNLSSLVLLLDCCHSGFFIERQLVEKTFTAFSIQKDYYVITACRSYETAKSLQGEAYGIFTGILLRGLGAENANANGQVTTDRLFDFISSEFRNDRLKGMLQEPVRGGWGNSICLVNYPKPEVPVQSDYFRGREDAGRALLERLRDVRYGRFLPMMGASGCGKSSILLSLLGITGTLYTVLTFDADAACFEQGRKEGKITVAVANFADYNDRVGERDFFENSLKDSLQERTRNYAQVCRLRKVAENPDEAIKLGKAANYGKGANIVVWSTVDNSDYWGGIVVVGWENPTFASKYPLPTVLADRYSFRTYKFGGLVKMLNHLAISQLQYSEGKIAEARKTLLEFLNTNSKKENEKKEYKELEKEKKEELAQAYFFLGYLFSLNPNPQDKQAMTAYQKAFDLDPELYAAKLEIADQYRSSNNIEEAKKIYRELSTCQDPAVAAEAFGRLAQIYHNEGDDLEAKKAYEKAIEVNSEEGYKLRALARLNWWNDIEGAITDIKASLKENPQNSGLYALLGELYLRNGNLEESKIAYQKFMCDSDEAERNNSIEILKYLIDERLAKVENVEQIIAQLQTPSLLKESTCQKNHLSSF